MSSTEESNESYWAVVGNIKKEIPYGEGGNETKKGTRQFKGGAKIRIIGSFPGPM